MLTPAQITILRTAIFADGTAGPLLTAGNLTGLLAWCNADSATRRWLPAADPLAVEEAPTYTTYDTLTQGKRDSWVMFLRNPRDFGKGKVRNWVVDVWGTATAASNAEAVLLAGTVLATNAQVAVGGTTKTTGTVAALDAVFEEAVSEYEGKVLIWHDNGTIWTAQG